MHRSRVGGACYWTITIQCLLIADTGWVYRTHGIGVDVTKRNGHGGVDFDFSTNGDNVFAAPDWWRLQLFARRAVHDNTVNTAQYAGIVDSLHDHADFVQSVIAARFENG